MGNKLNEWKQIKVFFKALSIFEIICLTIFFFSKIWNKLLSDKEKIYFITIFLLLIATILLFYYIIVKRTKIKYENIFLISVLLWGAIYNFSFPFASGADENKAFGTSYYVANTIIYHDDAMGELGGRKEDVFEDYGNNNIVDISPIWYLSISEGNWLGCDDGESAYIGYPPYTLSISWKYFVSIIAIIIGRGLQLGKYGLIYFTRYFSALYVGVMGYIAIKIAPICKAHLAFIGMIPLFLGVSSSMCYDAEFYPFLMLFISFFLKAYSSETIAVKEAMLSIFFGMLFVFHKPFFILYLLLPIVCIIKKIGNMKENKSNKKDGKIKLLLVFGVIAFVSFLMILKVGKRIFFHLLEDTGNNFSITYIFNNPKQTISVIINTFKNRGWWIVKQIFFPAEAMGFTFNPPMWFFLMFIIVIVLLHIMFKDKAIERKYRVLGWFIVLGTVFGIVLGALLRFISVEAIDSGYTITGRYVLPLFVLMIPISGNYNEESDGIYILYYIQNSFLIISWCYLINNIFCRYFVW